MAAIAEGAGLNTQGKGLTFSLPVDEVAGIVHLLSPRRTCLPSHSRDGEAIARKRTAPFFRGPLPPHRET